MAVEFIVPYSEAGKKISTVLLSEKPNDDLYPFKPGDVCREVGKAIGCKYTNHQHTQAWKRRKVRPVGSIVPKKNQVQSQYCHYDKAHRDYLYNQAWGDLLIAEEKGKTVKP